MLNKFYGPHDKNYGFVKEQICDLVLNQEKYIKERTRFNSKFVSIIETFKF
jgi:hypothetical protein